jgi:hypothetical protein
VRKAWESSLAGATVVLLVPARVDTRWWHDYIKPYAAVVDFPKGRLRYLGNQACPFPSAVVVFRPGRQYRCPWCKQPFRPARTDAKFCSARCKQAAYRARRVTDVAVTSVSIRRGAGIGFSPALS